MLAGFKRLRMLISADVMQWGEGLSTNGDFAESESSTTVSHSF